MDFYDDRGLATMYREHGSEDKGERSTFLYIREDLLNRYLRDTRQTLVWCNWGERQYLTKHAPMGEDGPPDALDVLRKHGNIYRTFHTFSGRAAGKDVASTAAPRTP